ncbi:MAG: TspO/MBR family protein [Roseicyclus sp.]|uniref:TspO/MBR family protein n=1 Tax=Roseicyclus sp. TaxID=1914329 RepID=UPI003A8C0C68
MQIAFNTLWTPVFFGLRRIRAGFVVMLGLWIAVAGTMVTFWQLDWIAGALFVPYLVWVTHRGRVERQRLDAQPFRKRLNRFRSYSTRKVKKRPRRDAFSRDCKV